MPVKYWWQSGRAFDKLEHSIWLTFMFQRPPVDWLNTSVVAVVEDPVSMYTRKKDKKNDKNSFHIRSDITLFNMGCKAKFHLRNLPTDAGRLLQILLLWLQWWLQNWRYSADFLHVAYFWAKLQIVLFSFCHIFKNKNSTHAGQIFHILLWCYR